MPKIFIYLCLCLFFVACVSNVPINAGLEPQANSKYDLTDGARLNYAQLRILQAYKEQNADIIIEACRTILDINPESDALVDANVWLISNRYNAEARLLLQQAIEKNKSKLSLYLLLAETYLVEHQVDTALELIRNYCATYPENMEAKIELALMTSQNGTAAEAIKVFAQISEEAKTSIVRYYYALALVSEKNYDKAIAELKMATLDANNPNFYEASAELANVYELIGNKKAAAVIYKELLAKVSDSNSEDAYRILSSLLKNADTKQTIYLASFAPNKNSFIYIASSLFLENGKYAEAKELLTILTTDKNAPNEIYFSLATISFDIDQNDNQTLEYIKKYENLENNISALILVTQANFNLRKLDEALYYAKLGQEKFSSIPYFWIIASQIYLTKNDLTAALLALETAYLENTEDAEVAYNLAMLHEQNDNRKKALEIMEEILENNPNNFAVMNYIGYTFAEENRSLDRAKNLISKALELSPNTDYILDSLAWVQYQLGEYSNAWESINQAVSLAKYDDSVMWEHYIYIAHANKLMPEVNKGLEKLRAINEESASRLEKIIADKKL